MDTYINAKTGSFEAIVEKMETVLGFITTELESANCSIDLTTNIAIATEEIFVNICHYAYTPNVGNVTIRVIIGEEIIIEFEDSGKPYNPLEKEAPDIETEIDVEDMEIGGMGILMVKNIMDAVYYRYEDNKNILTLRKKLDSEGN